MSYSLVLNGEPTPFLLGQQGLRQGDPLSPLLFTLVMEYLSRMLQVAAQDPMFRYHPLCKPLNLTSLAFVDDLLVFCKGQEYSVGKVKDVLDSFARTAGMCTNHMKSSLYMGGLSEPKQRRLLEITGFQKGEYPMRYLGFPL